MVQHKTLLKLAAGTFLAGSTGLYLAQKWMQNKVRNLPHYVEGLRIVSDHEQALKVIGTPIQVGAVDLSDNRHNYVGKTRSMLRIPITGSLDCGHMDVIALRPDDKSNFSTAHIKLHLQTAEVVIYDTHELNSKEGSLASD